MLELTINKEKHIEEILNNFDFEKVHNIMVALDWKWFGVGVPSVEDLKKQALELLNEICNYDITSSSTGGLKAIKCDDYLELEFIITSFDSIGLNFSLEYERKKQSKIRKNKINKINKV